MEKNQNVNAEQSLAKKAWVALKNFVIGLLGFGPVDLSELSGPRHFHGANDIKNSGKNAGPGSSRHPQ